MNGIWSEFAEEGLFKTDKTDKWNWQGIKEEKIITAPAIDPVDNININGIDGIDGILEMIIDRIDDGDVDGAKDDIRQLQEHFNEVL